MQIVENYKRPPQIVGQAEAFVNQAPFQLLTKSLFRLNTASTVVNYYSKTLRTLTFGNMAWVRLNNFQVEWDALLERKKTNDELSLPKISKHIGIVAFFDAYDTYTEEFIGQAKCPIGWIY